MHWCKGQRLHLVMCGVAGAKQHAVRLDSAHVARLQTRQHHHRPPLPPHTSLQSGIPALSCRPRQLMDAPRTSCIETGLESVLEAADTADASRSVRLPCQDLSGDADVLWQ